MSLVVLEHVSLHFGGKRIVDDLNLRMADGDRIGLIGPNGSGKTTLLRLVAGDQSPDGGEVRTARGVRVGWLPQDIEIEGGRTLLDLCTGSVPGRAEIEAELGRAEAAYTEILEAGDEEEVMDAAARLADLHERIAHFETTFSEHEAKRILAGLGFTDADHGRDIGEFSGGWKMRAVLASLLFQRPDVLLLDEPTNHLDMPSVAWFSAFLQTYRRPFVLISHDREFLNEQINRVVSLEVEGVRQFSGNYEQYVVQRAEEEVILENKATNPRARAREGDGVHHPLPRQGVQSQGGAEPHQGAREDGVGRDLPEAAGHELLSFPEDLTAPATRSCASSTCARPTAITWSCPT
ncbi:MAG: ATP-binding cassette domain-containing protein [Sandaracinaceae bacterium]